MLILLSSRLSTASIPLVSSLRMLWAVGMLTCPADHTNSSHPPPARVPHLLFPKCSVVPVSSITGIDANVWDPQLWPAQSLGLYPRVRVAAGPSRKPDTVCSVSVF